MGTERHKQGWRNGAAVRWFLLALIALVGTVSASAQISPGPLAKAHRDLNGPQNCIKCHAVSTRSANFRCVECHKEIAAELQSRKGLHATYPQDGGPGAACAKCHSDHNGENFNLVHWNPTQGNFDHTKTGYTLDGKHATLECRTCHTLKHIPVANRPALSTKDLNHTYMGLGTGCLDCHEDKHQGRFGANCTQCHTTSSWKGAKLDERNFDHSKTRFKLTGAHLNVECKKCHTAGQDGQPKYAGIAFDTCAACHTDPHKGEFKQDCGSCHSTATWKKSTFTTTFDHSKTKYPLLGKHLEVACQECHRPPNMERSMRNVNFTGASMKCLDCHENPHADQFGARGQDCASCHSSNKWKPSLFDHEKTKFSLKGGHQNVKCGACHTLKRDVEGKTVLFYKPTPVACSDCHGMLIPKVETGSNPTTNLVPGGPK